jgi:hypothetical protein
MGKIESLVETYLIAERALVAAVDASGGSVPLDNGQTVTVGRADGRASQAGLADCPTARADAAAAMTNR